VEKLGKIVKNVWEVSVGMWDCFGCVCKRALLLLDKVCSVGIIYSSSSTKTISEYSLLRKRFTQFPHSLYTTTNLIY